MADGRTIWWAKDAGWWRRELVVELGEEFGADGPAVLDWLSCEAKAQNDGGRVKSGFRSVARGCFVEVVTVGHVLSRSVTLGLLDDFEESNGRFVCRISGWRGDQERGRAAWRKALQREKESVSHGESRPVTSSHAEFHTGEKSSSSTAERAHPLNDQIEQAQAILLEVAGRDDADEMSLANAISRFPSVDFIVAVRGCAEYLKEYPAKRTVRTLHSFLEREAAKAPEATPTKRRGEALRELMGGTA